MPTALHRHVKARRLVFGSEKSGKYQCVWKVKACRPMRSARHPAEGQPGRPRLGGKPVV